MPPRLAARVQMLLAQPPEELSAEEAEVSRLTVEGMRPDWFGPEVRPLLRAYCTQTALAQFLAQELRALSQPVWSPPGKAHGPHTEALGSSAQMRCVSC
jgi:hypothetical protein